MKKPLVDYFGRVHTYLRISLTDRCNFRCRYCMPENPSFLSKKNLLNAEEIETVARYFAKMNIDKIRLTGGEPLVREDFTEISERLSRLRIPLHLTTNGYLLDRYIDQIDNYFESINISLDTLQKERFKEITRKDTFDKTMQNIELAIEHGINTKLNTVVIRGLNHDEIIDFVKLTLDRAIQVRFIEFMPFKGNEWSADKLYLHKDILNTIKENFPVEKIQNETGKTADLYRISGAPGSFGIISTVSKSFCSECNRIRVTSDGKLKNCLLGTDEFDLKPLLNDPVNFEITVRDALMAKSKSYGEHIDFKCNYPIHDCSSQRPMTAIGG